MGRLLGELLAQFDPSPGGFGPSPARSAPLPSASAIWAIAGVARQANRVGSMWFVVNSWKSCSATSMTPPGFDRRSRMRPLRGISARSRATSSTNVLGRSMSNVQSRR